MTRPTCDISPVAVGHDERPRTDVTDLLDPDAPSAPAGPTEELGRQLAAEMRRRWRAGERPAAEELLARMPGWSGRPEAAVDLIYEEYCLRAGGPGADDDDAAAVERDILRRFPQWAAPLRVMLDCHRRVLESADGAEPVFPAVGERVGDFRLLAELARGSRGRVFLATQTALADRPVVLKVTPLDGGEHLSLARLQHTNIVPLYSVLDDAARRVRVLCMPYFGRATLASLHEALAAVPRAERTGRHVVEAIDRLGASPASSPVAAAPPAVVGAARQMLAHVSYVQAMCWVTACLADALQFAHERGVVHLDLKPSNVLLAGDGQPMLLDFHLARAPIRPNGPLPENFGGTPPYMPPEQRAAMTRLQAGRAAEAVVDGRADLFALGAMLYESLGGQLPIADDAPPLSRVNPQASAGLSGIISRCIARRPEDRYADAASLADDLRRHLTDQPLRGARDRDPVERWHKWRRRRPGTLRAVAMLAVVVGATGVVLAGLWSHAHDRHEQAELALYDGQRHLSAGLHAEAAQAFERGERLLNHLPFAQDLRGQLHDQLATSRRLRLRHQLHRLADEIRVLYGDVDAIPAARRGALAAQCRALWQKRDAIVESLRGQRDADLDADLQDIAIFAASLADGAAVPSSSPSAVPHGASDRGAALAILNEAEAMFGPSAVLEHERASLLPARPASDTGVAADAVAPRTAWEHYALGRALLAAGDLPGAGERLAAARQLDPAGRWPNFYYGLCAYRTGRYEDAVAAFSVCIGNAPDIAGCYYNRALAYAALGRPEQALDDYDRALAIDPRHAAAALNRGMMHFQQARHEQALADLRTALNHGADPTTVHYDLALIHMGLHAPDEALRHARDAVAADPSHEPSRQLVRALQAHPRN